ncbi:forkhead box protein N2 isoform X2 [Nasonia vitripennis]|uniref:Fork-head domain-containing protein n=1 Tax=Nasonia vitripennis TaxID=7425 RepID=A0A7M7QAY9_NASVI|nr:forkhead box protein N2 isoform X2 [Nasonia vitripennis]XP_032455546.1 forkhead box protein N2 isoform X2 [Nasonia vitripennis]XP_032455547.1 forkhead box protein N2 isoform X2 [Nasonia vitripennis]
MAPDRPDASDVETGSVADPVVTRVFGFCEAFTLKEGDNANHQQHQQFVEEQTIAGDEIVIEEEEIPMIPKSEPGDEKTQSDDDLTSLSWLHQQNLLKSLEITEHPGKVVKEENVINNNIICEDSLDISENTNSVSSLDDSYSPESNGKSSVGSTHVLQYDDVVINGQSPSKSNPDSAKSPNGTAQSNQVKHNNNNNNNNNSSNSANFNLPVPNRNKHPTHIPYDPYLHKNSKPPYSFSCLIFMAIEDSPVKALPVKEVYAWILEHFPYFRNAPTGWKNSVRHNLSLNKCFRKVEKSPVSYTQDAVLYNLGKGSLWMVDAQYRSNLIQALSRSPFPPPTATNISTPEKIARKVVNSRLPDPVLFPYLSKRLASSNIGENSETEFDSDVDAAAAAMLSFKHGPIILNHNKDRKKKQRENEKMVPVITRSSTEDHTYSLITSVRLERRYTDETAADVDEQRKIAEGADALLNLAGVNTTSLRDPLAPDDEEEEEVLDNSEILYNIGSNNNNNSNASRYVPGSDPLEIEPTLKRRPSGEDAPSSKRRKRSWRETWNENGRYLKQVRG